MSNKGKYTDYTPFIRPAGITNALEDITTDQSIRQDLYFKPSATPSHLIKYRNTLRYVPGIKQVHRGIFDDPKPYENYVHGIKTSASLHVDDCIKDRNRMGTKAFLSDLMERRYASYRREPLGHSLRRNYVFPEEVKDDKFRFGVPTVGFYHAKDVIYNAGPLSESADVKKLYKKTHGISDPGEQLDREYSWRFDKHNHIYGKPFTLEKDGVKKSLDMENLGLAFPRTKLANRLQDEFHNATKIEIGKPKLHGSIDPNLPKDFVFGVKSDLEGAWNAEKCIYGDPKQVTEKTVAPDPDLGRSKNYRTKFPKLMPLEVDLKRTFGVPTIRTDLPKKEFRSVTDTHNYGGEKDAYDLLYPHPCATRGIDDEDFDALYTKEEIIKTLADGGYTFPEEEFDKIYEIAQKNYPGQENKLSPLQFMATMRNLKREYYQSKMVQH